MKFGAAVWINQTTWPELRDACLAAEAAGWDSLWIDDHLLADEGDPSDPKLEGWATLSAAGRHHRPCPARAARGGQHVPRPGPDRQARDDGRPHLERSTRPRPRWRMVRARARRLRARFRWRVRGASRPARGGGRADPAAARRRPRDARGPVLHDARRALYAATGPGPPADPDRRIRSDQDAPDDGSSRRPVERLRPARADRGDQRDPARALRGGRPPVRRHRADRDHRRGRPRVGGRRRSPPGPTSPDDTGSMDAREPTARIAGCRSAGPSRTSLPISMATAGSGSARSSSRSAPRSTSTRSDGSAS